MDEMKSSDGLRSPIYSFFGDYKAGKSQLLSCLGCQKVIENPKKEFTFGTCYLQRDQLEDIAKKLGVECKLESPGFLMVEVRTPNGKATRSRCVEFSDFVIVVVDAQMGLTSGTTELINMIIESARPSAIVLNKIDAMKQHEIKEIYEQIKGLRLTQRIVSVSALRGEGIPELVDMLFHMSQSLDRKILGRRAECKIVDAKEVLGHGTLLLVVVVDGVLYAKDTVVVSSTEEFVQVPIVSKIKALWLPQKLGDLLVAEGPYDKEEEEIRAGRGVLVALENQGRGALLDLSLQVLGPEDDVNELKKKAIDEALIADMRLKLRFGIR